MMLRFAGSKGKLLPLLRMYIDRLVDGQDSFHDAFLGSGAVLLDTAHRHPNLRLYANDADAGLVAFWKVVSGRSVKAFCDRIRNTKPTLRLFQEVRESKPKKQEEIAFRFYFLNRTTFSGLAESGPIGGFRQRSQYRVNERWLPEKSVKDIVEANQLLSGRLTLSCLSGTQYVSANSKEPLFIDPPYFRRGDLLYPQKMTFADHLRLSRLLRKADKWVLTFDENPVVRQLYRWACIHIIPARYQIEAVRPRRASAHELVITPG
jgi:DNA adenine methylase